jgi:hypothetical protein
MKKHTCTKDLYVNFLRSTSIRYSAVSLSEGVIKGIGVLNFLWLSGDKMIPFDYRIYQPPADGKTKNNHLRETLSLAHARGVNPDAVIADSWFGSLDNLKSIRILGWRWLIGLKKNRKVNRNENLSDLNIPKEGLKVHLKGYRWIHVFKFESKERRIDYVGTNIEEPSLEEISELVGKRWNIEVYHRELKQACGFENCQARTSRSQWNQIELSMLCWIRRANQRAMVGANSEDFENWFIKWSG